MAATGDTLRVMVVEDEGLVATMVGRQLTRLGHAVVGYAADGIQALSEAAALLPDLIMMDIDIPEIDGIEVARLLCQTTPVPVVLMTAYQSPDLIRRAAEAGVVGYLAKPPQSYEIERTIPIAMARFGEMAEMRRLLQMRDEALLRARQLEGMLPICSYCKKIRDEGNTWHSLERYISDHSSADFTHGICPECMTDVLGDLSRPRAAD